MSGNSYFGCCGIERYGDNHICLYPNEEVNEVSDISPGKDSFVVNALKQIVPLWRPYALLKFKAEGYSWPDEFPADSRQFPIRHRVKYVVLSGEADMVESVASRTEEFVTGSLDWLTYFRTLLSVGSRFSLVCGYDEIIVNIALMTALRFALTFNCMLNNSNQRFVSN